MKKLFLMCCLFIGIIATANAQAPSDPAKKAKGLQTELKLSDSQTSKVAVIYQESAQKFDKIKVKENGNTDKMIKDIGPLRAATVKKIKAILTPSQSAKYDALLKDKNNLALNGGWSGGWGGSEGS